MQLNITARKIWNTAFLHFGMIVKPYVFVIRGQKSLSMFYVIWTQESLSNLFVKLFGRKPDNSLANMPLHFIYLRRNFKAILHITWYICKILFFWIIKMKIRLKISKKKKIHNFFFVLFTLVINIAFIKIIETHLKILIFNARIK